jgi:hypothetical protein
MQVDGFHLVFLCHRFGRRGRHFVDSILRQEDSPHIELTGFYCEDEDAVHLGSPYAGDAPDKLQSTKRTLFQVPPERAKLTLFQIPEHRIMERSVLFSMVEPQCSHVVFIDCDLWFPPKFWQSYARALQDAPHGYWSAYVLDIPYDEAEPLVSRPQLSEIDLFRRHAGMRYPHQSGAVGHFQCVPAELAKYPAHRLASVAKIDDAFAQWAIGRSVDKCRERRLPSLCAYHLGHPYCWEGTQLRL